VQTIRSAGGTVYYDYFQYDDHITGAEEDVHSDSRVRKFLRACFGDAMFGKVKMVLLERNARTINVSILRELPRLKSITLKETPLTRQMVSQLSKIRNTNFLKIYECPMTVDAWEEVGKLSWVEKLDVIPVRGTTLPYHVLGSLKNLRQLNIQYTKVDLSEISGFRNIDNIKHLILNGSAIRGMENITKFRNLRTLSLNNAKLVGDAEHSQGIIGYVKNLDKLNYMYLDHLKNIDDGGIIALSEMPRLRRLSVKGTEVTQAGVARLKSELPNCFTLGP